MDEGKNVTGAGNSSWTGHKSFVEPKVASNFELLSSGNAWYLYDLSFEALEDFGGVGADVNGLDNDPPND